MQQIFHIAQNQSAYIFFIIIKDNLELNYQFLSDICY